MISGSWCFVGLSRTNQLLALSASGERPRRALVSLLVFGALWSALVWAVAAEISPRSLSRFELDLEDRRTSWSLIGGDTLVRARDGVAASGSGSALIVELEGGEPRRWLDAGRVARVGDGWELVDVIVTDERGVSRTVSRMPSPAPIHGSRVARDPRRLNTRELRAQEEDSRRRGADSAPYAAERGLRRALAACCVPCLLLGALLGARFGRRATVAALTVALAGLGSWALLAPCWALASVGALPALAVSVFPAAVLSMVVVLLVFGRERLFVRA